MCVQKIVCPVKTKNKILLEFSLYPGEIINYKSWPTIHVLDDIDDLYNG